MELTDKKQIRTEIKRQTAAMSCFQRATEAEYVLEWLQQYITTHPSGVLAMFYPLGDEIDIRPLAEFALDKGWRVVMPRMDRSEESLMEFYDFSAEQMAHGRMGVMEPQSGEVVGAEQIDLMIVPGVAFTVQGERLGRGRGYYDRYMGRTCFRAKTIGVCFAHQLLPTLPVEQHDKRVDRVLFLE